MILTVIFFVDYGDPGPVKKGHKIPESSIQMILRGIQVYTELLEGRLEVDPRLDVRHVQGLADALNVGAEERVRGAEDPLH